MGFVALIVSAIHKHFRKFIDFEQCRLLPIFWEWHLMLRIFYMCRAVVTSAALIVAALAIIVPLLSIVLGGTAPVEASIAGRLALAGLVTYIGAIHLFVHEWLRPARLAFAVKARVPWPATEYVETKKYPEFE